MISEKPLVSVIIPTTDKGTIVLCKQALQKQTLKPYETIVIHDQNRQGASWARNEGIKKAKGNYIAFLDDDCIPPENWLESLVKAIEKYRAHGAGGTYEETDPLLSDRRRRQGFPDVEQVDESGLVCAGGNLMFRASWLREMQKQDGYVFNLSFKISQDWEFIWRSHRREVKLVYIPVKVKHLKKLTALSYWRQQFGRGRGIAKLYKMQRSFKDGTILHRSLIWGEGGGNFIIKWLKVFWYKGVGPFDIKSFQRKRDFLVFWIGEKFQSLGFCMDFCMDYWKGDKNDSAK